MNLVIKPKVHILYDLVNISSLVIYKKDFRFLDDEKKEFLQNKGYGKEYKLLADLHFFMKKEVEKSLKKYPLAKKMFCLGNKEDEQVIVYILGYSSLEKIEDYTKEEFLKLIYITMKAGELTALEPEISQELLGEVAKEGLEPSFYLKHVLESTIAEDEKLILLEALQNFDEYYSQFVSYFRDLEKAYESKMGPLLPLLEKKGKLDQEDHGRYYTDWIKAYSATGDHLDKEAWLNYSFLIPAGLAAGVSMISDQRLRFFAGILFSEMDELLRGKKQQEKDLLESFKALGDESRLKIIQLVSHKAYYMKELADELKLTPSTLSHHVDNLLHAGLLRFYTKGRRVYLELGTEKIKNLAQTLTQLAERGEDDLQ